MAISGGDGSIILTTQVDETGLKKGLVSLKRLGATAGKAFLAIGAAAATATVAITKMAVSAYADYEQLVGGVETLFKDSAGKVLEYANQAFQTAGVSANEYMQQVTSFSASLLSSLAGDTDKAADIANMALIDISDNANKMGSSLESVTLAYQGFAKGQYMLLDNLKLGYGGTKTEMERLLKDAEAYLATQGKTAKFSIDNLADVYTAINAIQQKLDIAGTTMDEAETTITGSLGMVKASWQNLLTAMAGGGDLDRAINSFVYSLERFASNLAPVIQRTLIGLGQALEKTLPVLVQMVANALAQQIPNLVMAVYNMIIGLFKGILLGIKALFTGGTAKATKTIEQSMSGISSNTGSAAKSAGDLAKNTKKAGKEAKKVLATFDDLNILSGGASGGGAGETPQPSIPTISAGGGAGGGLIGEATNAIEEQLYGIMAIAGFALVAIGLILLHFGKIGWGLAFIIAGAVTFVKGEQGASKSNIQNDLANFAKALMGAIGGAMLAIGIILLYFKTSIPTAIGLIVKGAVLIVGSATLQGIFNPNDIASWLSIIMGIAGGALLAIGIFLCYMKVYPQGIGMIIAGTTSLVSAVVLGSDDITSKIKGWVAVIMAIAGASLLALGIIMCASGVALPLGIALIAAGAIGLVTPIALNWDVIVDWVAGAWQAVKDYWNKYIAPIFTFEFWLDLGKKAFQGLIDAAEWAVEKVKGFFEGITDFAGGVIGGVTDFLGDVFGGGEWIEDWVGSQSKNSRTNATSYSLGIPALARGAVIPPNREFLAVLGDNKRENEIVSPVSTMKQAFTEAMIEMGGRFGGGNTEVVLEIDGREFGRAVVEQGNRENRRIGTRLVIA